MKSSLFERRLPPLVFERATMAPHTAAHEALRLAFPEFIERSTRDEPHGGYHLLIPAAGATFPRQGASLRLETQSWTATVPLRKGISDTPPAGDACSWCTIVAPGRAPAPAFGFSRDGDRLRVDCAFEIVEEMLFAFNERHTAAAWMNLFGPVDEPESEPPTVSILACILKEIGARTGMDLHAAAHERPAPRRDRGRVVLTHDIDALSKNFGMRIRKAGVMQWLAAQRLLSLSFGRAMDCLRWSAKLGVAPGDYREAVDELLALEKERSVSSLFFLSVSGSGMSSSNRMEPGYDVRARDFKNIIDGIIAGGSEIGLHASRASAVDPERLIREKKLLESILRRPVRANRFHWLSFDPERTPEALHAAGFECDYTLGFVDRPGARNRMVSPFRLPSVSTLMVPTLFMDMSMLFAAPPPPCEEIASRAVGALEWVERLGGLAAVNWHNETLAQDYGWKRAYETFLEALGRRGLRAVRPAEMSRGE